MSTKLWDEVADILRVPKGGECVINITNSNGTTSQFNIFNEKNNNHTHLQNCLDLATEVSTRAANTYRRHRKDKGDMYILGNGKFPNGKEGMYHLTNDPSILCHLTNVCSSAKDYYLSLGLDTSIDEMREKQIHELHPAMKHSFVSSVVISCNLLNSFHVDVNDATRTILTWITDTIHPDEKWFFILPNVTRDNQHALILQIEHGLTIEFDSTTIFHCSTNEIKNNNTKLCGIAFVCRKD